MGAAVGQGAVDAFEGAGEPAPLQFQRPGQFGDVALVHAAPLRPDHAQLPDHGPVCPPARPQLPAARPRLGRDQDPGHPLRQPGQLGRAGGLVHGGPVGGRRPGVLRHVAVGPLVADGQVQGCGDDRVNPQDRCRPHWLAHVRRAPAVAGVGPTGAVIPKRPAPLVASMRTSGMVLGLREPAAKPRALLERRVEAVEGVSAELADLHVPEHRPDGAANVALMRFSG